MSETSSLMATGGWRDGLRPRWPLAAGLAALAVYALTLSRGVYPGQSALLMAYAAGLSSDSLPAHPLWSLAAGWVARAPFFPLMVRLNLFSALCAATTVGLLGLLMERWLLRVSRDSRDGAERPMCPELEDSPDAVPAARAEPLPNPAVEAHKRQAAAAARCGGWAAALALAVSVPFWSTATRLHFQTFDMLLLLAVVLALQAHFARPSLARALPVAVLCGLGCVESAVLIPVSPLVFLVMLRNRMRVMKPWSGQMLASLLMAALGALTGLLLLWSLRMEAAGQPVSLRTVLVGMLRAHYTLLRHALPGKGWIWFLLLAYAPAAIAFLAARRALTERTASMMGMHLVLTAAAVLCLFNAPISPWGLARQADVLPVMACLAVALAVGYLVAYWRMLMTPLDIPDDALGVAEDLPARWGKAIGVAVSWLLAGVVVTAAVLNLRVADGRNGAFADLLARDLLDRLGSRTWMVCDGMLDNHLLILARDQRRSLRLVSLAHGVDAARQRRLRGMIDAEPAFAARRVRLYNAAALGPLPFVQEWLAGDPEAGARLLIVGAPEIWTRTGFRPVPDGMGFEGARDLDSLRGRDFPARNRAAWACMAKALAPGGAGPPGLARFRAALRREAGLAVNNLGVLLEDLARPEEAWEAYEAANRIDPRNLSALLNRHALAQDGTRAKTRPALEREIKALVGREKKLPPLDVVVNAYGEIRWTAALARHGLAWSDIGQTELARADINRALALAPTNAALRHQLASLAMRRDRTVEGEQTYREILAARPDDVPALIGLAKTALARGRTDEARDGIERARKAGASEAALAIPTAILLSATGRDDEALAALRALTERDPGHFEAWSLQAEILLRRAGLDEVEQRVLPAMVKAAGKGDHVLVHLVRASLLRAKRPVDFAAARTSLLLAIKLRPDLLAIRDDLLLLDLGFGSPAVRERDAIAILRSDPEHALANYVLGSVLLDSGELLRAEDLFRRSLAEQPAAMAQNDLAEALRRMRRYAEAERSARAALALNDKSGAAWDTLGCVLLDVGKADEAAQAVEKALSLRAGDPRIHLTLARIRLAQGRPDEARAILNRPILTSAGLPPGMKREIAVLAGQAEKAAP